MELEVPCSEIPVPGSIEYAKCSQEADAHSIRREIGDRVHHVDHAIRVLLTAGMSTPALRSIAHSVNIKHAAFAEITGAVFMLNPAKMVIFILGPVLFGYEAYWGGEMSFAFVFLMVFFLWLLLINLIVLVVLWRSSWDEQRFILKVTSKIAFLKVICQLLTLPLVSFMHMKATEFWLYHVFSSFCSISMVAFTFLGIRRTAELPAGLHALQFFFSRGSNTWSSLKAPCLWI